MVMARVPMTYKCRSCNWSKSVPECSDALICGVTHFDKCPICGCGSVNIKKTNFIKSSILKLSSNLKRR